MSITQKELNVLKGRFVKTSGSVMWGVRDKASKEIQDRMDEARLQELTLVKNRLIYILSTFVGMAKLASI